MEAWRWRYGLSRGGGRVSRRLDRLSERQFALLVSIPGLILVALIVLPPTLAVFGMSLFRIELGKDDLTPFVGLNNYLVRLPLDDGSWRRSTEPCSSPRCRPPSPCRSHWSPRSSSIAASGRVDLLHGPADAVGGRVDVVGIFCSAPSSTPTTGS
jgi:hypothetical protein